MGRLTKTEIEHELLAGRPINWVDASDAAKSLVLGKPTQRRLFSFLLNSETRQPTNLPAEFVEGLATALVAGEDPAAESSDQEHTQTESRRWRLRSIHTEEFGGLNTCGGPPFSFSFDGQSYLLEGPNGSGKSSLIGAILWALTGERPRDQSEASPHVAKPVFGPNGDVVGQWPPIACYPDTPGALSAVPDVSVKLTFEDGPHLAVVERKLSNGELSYIADPTFTPPAILIETGLLMPSRLGLIRLDDGGGRLTDAVQKLTGLDELREIGELAAGLCHGSREYVSHPKKAYLAAKQEFEEEVDRARVALTAVGVAVPQFQPHETADAAGPMAALSADLSAKAGELANVVADDVGGTLDLSKPAAQNEVIAAIGAARDDLARGLRGCPTWGTLSRLSEAVDEATAAAIESAATKALKEGSAALQYLRRLESDNRFQLKAVAAEWHQSHSEGAIETCPLCLESLSEKPQLTQELEELRSAGEAATRQFSDNVNRVLLELAAAVPKPAAAIEAAGAPEDPDHALRKELSERLVEHQRYSDVLVGFAKIATIALEDVPPAVFNPPQQEALEERLQQLEQKITSVRRLVGLAKWFRGNAAAWQAWWTTLCDVSHEAASGAVPKESLGAHVNRLSDALEKANPYREGAACMRRAWRAGEKAFDLQKEYETRTAVIVDLDPLRSLGSLAEAVVREAINGLSARVSEILAETHIGESLQFRQTKLEKKKVLVVRGAFGADFQIDATLVANTSWLRSVLWAFLFALREEAVEQIGLDPLPLMVLDDPQATFDNTHRHRWAQRIAALQGAPNNLQFVIASHDELFLELIGTSGVLGRRALIASPGPELRSLGVFEGEALSRRWEATIGAPTPSAGQAYLADVRMYAEALLRIMLRGADPAASSLVLGEARERVHQLHRKGIAPWSHPEFSALVTALDKNKAEIRHIQMAHHPTGAHLGMSEAQDVHKYWTRSLRPALEHAFRLAREHFLLHGGLTALHAAPADVELPEGYQNEVRAMRFQLVGSAAALTGGRMSDGLVDFTQYGTSQVAPVRLGKHFAYRLTKPTLEPAARIGDLLLVREIGEPSAKSLVIAVSGDRVLARRFELSDSNDDVAVLTSHAINPREIAPPLVAHKGTLKLHKIIGVVYAQQSWGNPPVSADEACECGGSHVLTRLANDEISLVKIDGQSAEPDVLDGQYLMLGAPVSGGNLAALDGCPIVAADDSGTHYFKRLRNLEPGRVLLESMDIGGYYPPVVLSTSIGDSARLDQVWPVIGVLFELPS